MKQEPPVAANDKLAKLQRVFQYMDFQVLPNMICREIGAPMDVMIYPAWVLNCGSKLTKALFPQLCLIANDATVTEEYRMGFLAGSLEAGQLLIGTAFAPLLPTTLPEVSEEQGKQISEFLYRGYAADFTQPTDDLIPGEIKNELAERKESFDLPKSVDYSRGFADAQAMVAGENHATTTTRIYLNMLLFWRVVEVIPNIEKLDEILVKILGRNAIGHDPKRLSQICNRIGKRFQPPGRPRKQLQPRKSVK